jgi:hypothetical protein
MANYVTGVFPYKDKLIAAINKLKEMGYKDQEVKMPVPDHDILDALDHKPSKIGFITLIAGITGMITGYVGPAWAHLHWGHVIGGKPITAFPPFLVVMFELTILFGAVSTFIGLFLMARKRMKRAEFDPYYDPRCSDDHYALVVAADDEKVDEVKKVLLSSGAEVKA